MAWSLTAVAGVRVLKMDTADGPYRLKYDSKRISEKRLRAAMAVSPHANIPGIEMLPENQANVDRSTRQYEALKALPVPKELAEAREHVKRSGAFYIWLLKTRLEYYRTGELHVLKKTFADLEPESRCTGALEKIAGAKSQQDANRFARVDWHNCMNAAFHKRYGSYPVDVWKAFLSKYGIRELSD